MESAGDLLFQLGFFLLLLALGYGFGQYRERKHLSEIAERLRRNSDIGVTNQKRLPAGSGPAVALGLVCGSVVIATDYFKLFTASWRNVFGGEIRSLVTLAHRARQEALLRMLDDARSRGANAVINVRFEISAINEPRSKQAGTVEAFVYGTAIRAG